MAFGLGLRALCVALLTFGLMLFVDDAFSLGNGALALLIRAVLPTAVFAVILTLGF